MQGVDRLSMRLDADTALRSLIAYLPQKYLFILHFYFIFSLFFFTRLLKYQVFLQRVRKCSKKDEKWCGPVAMRHWRKYAMMEGQPKP